jgi:hypothetical protein
MHIELSQFVFSHHPHFLLDYELRADLQIRLLAWSAFITPDQDGMRTLTAIYARTER